MSSKNTIEQFLQILVHVDMKTTKRSIFWQKTPKSIHPCSNQFWNPVANVSLKVQPEQTWTGNLTQRWKRLVPSNDATIFTRTRKQKRRVSKLPYLSPNNVWAWGWKLVWNLEKTHFFCLCRQELHFQHQQGTQRAGAIIGSIFIMENTTIAVNGVDT